MRQEMKTVIINENSEKEIQTKEILDYYSSRKSPSSQEIIIEMLRELQELHGCIGPALQEMAAQAAGVKLTTIQAIIKRIPSLKESDYKHEIIICTGKNCAAGGSPDILQELKKELGIKGDGLSGDGTVFLRTRVCMKHCSKAPNVMVDGRLYSGKSAQELMELVCG